jgi:hypothetical protein
MASPHGSISTDGQSGPHIAGLGQRTITILGVEIEQQLEKLVRDSVVAAFAKHRQEIYPERGDDRLNELLTLPWWPSCLVTSSKSSMRI